MTLTIFTPTYNRGDLLPRLFESLKKQSCKDFEWIVVDDGSTDGSAELITSFQKEADFPIILISQKNGGKHRAINRGVNIARGSYFLIVDSDDWLTTDAVEWIAAEGEKIIDNPKFGGFAAIRMTPDGKRIGGGENFGTLDISTFDFRLRKRIAGDMAEVTKTSVMREFPFPEFESEKFCPEALIWNRIGRKYLFRWIHYGIYYGEYLPGGLTSKITRIRRESPKASMLYYSELFHTAIPLMEKVKAALNFWRFSFAKYSSEYRMMNFIGLMAYLPGQLLKLKDR